MHGPADGMECPRGDDVAAHRDQDAVGGSRRPCATSCAGNACRRGRPASASAAATEADECCHAGGNEEQRSRTVPSPPTPSSPPRLLDQRIERIKIAAIVRGRRTGRRSNRHDDLAKRMTLL
jgi:hypothetical protein